VALQGAPGVRSKRFSGRTDLSGADLDHANNEYLRYLLAALPAGHHSAHYVCVIAIVAPDGREDLFRGTVDGVILDEPRGTNGFGYDPLFFVPPLDATLAEVPPDVKNTLSHRARAVSTAVPRLLQLARQQPDSAPEPA
jgi:XTP/dITP diphosphohydrolase